MSPPERVDATSELVVDGGPFRIADLQALDDAGVCHLDRLPVSIRILPRSKSTSRVANTTS